MTEQEIVLKGIVATMEAFGWKKARYTLDSVWSQCYQIDNSFTMLRSRLAKVLEELGFDVRYRRHGGTQRVVLETGIVQRVLKEHGMEIEI